MSWGHLILKRPWLYFSFLTSIFLSFSWKFALKIEMTEVATEAMEETDLNVDLTVVENILVETIEIEVTQMKSNMNS